MSKLRPLFVEAFGEAAAVALETAAQFHKDGPNFINTERVPSDPFAYVLMSAASYQCIEKYAEGHNFPSSLTFKAFDAWAREHAIFEDYDGPFSFLDLITQRLTPYTKAPK